MWNGYPHKDPFRFSFVNLFLPYHLNHHINTKKIDEIITSPTIKWKYNITSFLLPFQNHIYLVLRPSAE